MTAIIKNILLCCQLLVLLFCNSHLISEKSVYNNIKPLETTYRQNKRYYCQGYSVFIPTEKQWLVLDSCKERTPYLKIGSFRGTENDATIIISIAPIDTNWYRQSDSLNLSLSDVCINDYINQFQGIEPEKGENVDVVALNAFCMEAGKNEARKSFMIVLDTGYTPSPNVNNNESDVVTAVSALTMSAILGPTLGIIVIPLPGNNSSSGKYRLPEMIYGVVAAKIIQKPKNPVVVYATLFSKKIDGAQLHYFRYIISSIRAKKNSDSSEIDYIPYSLCLSTIVLTNGKRGKGHIDKIDSTHIHYRKIKGGRIISISKKHVRAIVDGVDTLWIRKSD